MSTHDNYDVIIVGGGIIGSSMACALGQIGFKTALIDANEPQVNWPYDGFDNRVSAITIASQRLFKSLNAWPLIKARRISPYLEMHVWDKNSFGEIHFDCANTGQNYLGYIIENKVILGGLLAQLSNLEKVTYLKPIRCHSLNINPQVAKLELTNGQHLTAPLIIGADGAHSWVRQQQNIDCTGWQYQQQGIVCTVTTQHHHQHTAWQRFLPHGPLALLPLSDGHCSVVWSNTSSEAKQLLALTDPQFIQAIQAALGDSPLGNIKTMTQRAAFPLRFQHANQYTKSRLALIGDAAHTVHPLAGQGANLGLLDVAQLAETIFHARQKRWDIGSSIVLRKYERARKGDNLIMMSTVDGLKRLFGNSAKPLSLIRNLGLNLTNATPLVKNRLLKHAMGINNNLPSLAKGQPLN